MKRKLLVAAVFTLIVVPTALFSAFWSFMGGALILAALSGDPSVAGNQAAFVTLALVFGWAGIASLWKLSVHFFYNPARPIWFRRSLLGLACGVAVSGVFIATSGGSAEWRLLFFGWPVVAAAVLAILAWRAPHAT